jgi:hypothetical protein
MTIRRILVMCRVDEMKMGGQHDVFMQWQNKSYEPLPTVNVDVAAKEKMKVGISTFSSTKGQIGSCWYTTYPAHVSGWYGWYGCCMMRFQGCCMFELHALKFT